MKTIGQTYPLSEFEPGDVGAFVEEHGDGEPFVVIIRHSAEQMMVQNKSLRLIGDGAWLARYLGRGRIEPARIVMEDA